MVGGCVCRKKNNFSKDLSTLMLKPFCYTYACIMCSNANSHVYTHGICTTHIIYIVYVLYTSYTHRATVCADADACAAPPFVSAALLLTNSIPPPLQPNHHCSESLRCAMVQHNTVSIINVQSCALACLICVYCVCAV